MVELADIFRRAEAAYVQAFGGRIPPSHLRAMCDIVRCRTPALGGSLYSCDDKGCGSLTYAYHSCRNRHCPKCQNDRAQDWLDRLRARLLPCDHYLITFTLPAELRDVARSNQRLVYALLFREAAAAVQAFAADPTWVGGRLAILAVLHTWSRSQAYHPHVHMLVSAGGLSPDGTAWMKPAHPRFLFPGYALSKVFRAKVKTALSKASLGPASNATLWDLPWTVHIQQIGSGEHAALYLSRYVFKVALTNNRIERFENGQVTFRYTHARSRRMRRMTLPVLDFIARFLQHVLPRGFCKIRYYGLLSPSSRDDLERARQLLLSAAAHVPQRPSTKRARNLDTLADRGGDSPDDPPQPRLCPVCKRGHLRFVGTLHRPRGPP